jgi:two-component system, chemotaxis family, CheB/CheR fusion protein
VKKTREKHIKESAAFSSEAMISDCGHGAIPYIVGIGASAGGLEAFEQFFSHLPADTGLVFVLVPHLEPTHKGMMPELLGRHTKMPVVEVEDGIQVQPNCVYVIPPNADLSILHGKLQVLEPVAPRGLRLPIDFFFRHLAADQKENAIGIILSGMGSDGTLGLKAIKENFGMAMVQDPSSAKYDGMPRSAINSGVADYIAEAEGLPAKLIQYCSHVPAATDEHAAAEGESSAGLEKVFVLLRIQTGNDFSCYKKSTIHRRIERRMNVHQFDRLPRYIRFLQGNPQEVDLLYKELLIGVTNFFRDPGLFDFLKEKAFPQLLRARPAVDQVRVWDPGCSTGEETYSLAILLNEIKDEIKGSGVFICPGDQTKTPDPFIQIFATDIDKDAIDKARQGTFSAGIASDVSPERLSRFFVHEDEHYRIKKEIRDMVVFAPQNILVDPPFTKVDILCCRNLLIYVNAETQKKLLPLMHYALNPGGLLILGSAESVGSFDHLFTPLDKRWKVYQRNEVFDRPRIEMPARVLHHAAADVPAIKKTGEPDMDITYAAQRTLLDFYGPPSVVINSEGDIIYLNGRTGKYLEPSSGKVNMNVYAMAREGLREELGAAIHNAVARKSAVIVSGIKVKSNGGSTTVNLTVRPLAESAALRGMLLVVFEETVTGQSVEANAGKPSSEGHSTPPSELEEELHRTRERLQSATEEMQAAQEEFRSTNEELQSNNEELQSTNEELNSSKEEMQSLNEEMQTVNAELQMRIEELAHSNSDMKNLLNGTDLATLFLDNDLAVKRFTPQATKIVNLVAGDVGRPLGHFATNLKYDRLVQDANNVLDTLVPKEAQVQANDGRWYNMRILPYRTVDNMIDGVVMTFADITALKQMEETLRRQRTELQAARDYAKNMIATIREPLLVLDDKLRIMSASHSFYETFQVTPAATEGQLLYEIGQRQWEIPSLRQLLEEILSKSTSFENFRVEHDFPTIGHKALLLNARKIVTEDRQSSLILLAMEDVTDSSTGPKQPMGQP